MFESWMLSLVSLILTAVCLAKLLIMHRSVFYKKSNEHNQEDMQGISDDDIKDTSDEARHIAKEFREKYYWLPKFKRGGKISLECKFEVTARNKDGDACVYHYTLADTWFVSKTTFGSFQSIFAKSQYTAFMDWYGSRPMYFYDKGFTKNNGGELEATMTSFQINGVNVLTDGSVTMLEGKSILEEVLKGYDYEVFWSKRDKRSE